MYLLSALQGHCDVLLARRERHPDRVQAGDEVAVGAEHVENLLTHAGHDAHVRDHVGRVRELDTDLRDGRAEGAHAEGNHVESPALHAAAKQTRERRPHLGGVAPVVRRTCILLARRTDEGAILDPRDVGRI